MAGRSSYRSLLPLVYLLLIVVAPLAFLQTAHAQDDAQIPLEDDAKAKDLGTGEYPLAPDRMRTLLTILTSHWYRPRHNLLLRRCDAEWQSRNSRKRPG